MMALEVWLWCWLSKVLAKVLKHKQSFCHLHNCLPWQAFHIHAQQTLVLLSHVSFHKNLYLWRAT